MTASWWELGFERPPEPVGSAAGPARQAPDFGSGYEAAWMLADEINAFCEVPVGETE